MHPRTRVTALLILLTAALMTALAAAGRAPAFDASSTEAIASLRIDHLRCEYRADPLGIHTTKPRLSWRMIQTDPDQRGLFMATYRIVAARSREALERGEPLLWDSGHVQRPVRNGEIDLTAPFPTIAEYAGEPLTSRDEVWWKVMVHDQHLRASDWSEPAHFSIGLLEQSDWQGEWIGLDAEPEPPLTTAVRDELRRRPWIRVPGPAQREARTAHFRRAFTLPDAPITRAWLAGTADMLATMHLNGEVIGDLARWEPVHAIEVTSSSLRAGENVIGARVEHHDGFSPALTGMLLVEFDDGRVERILFDESWKWSRDAASGWDVVNFDETGWSPVERSGNQPWGGNRNTEHFMGPAPHLRTTFTVDDDTAITRATLYATALGLFECSLNGERIGDDVFAPGWTEYSKRVEHRTYDVTNMLVSGDNCLGAVLGDGWYAGLLGYTGRRGFYGAAPRFRAQLDIEYADGTRQVITTNDAWRASFGEIVHNDLYMGTHIDTRRAMPGWNTADFDASGWRAVQTGIARPTQRAADVTPIIRDRIENNRVSFVIGPQVLGDPAYGVVKTLHIDYTVGGEAKSVSLPENVTLELPREGEAGELRIVRAIFSEPPPSPAEPFIIEPARSDAVKTFEELPAISINEPRPGRFIFDLGQNMVGWVRLKIAGQPGQRITLRHAEMLNPDGTLYTSNLRGATATDFFTLSGGEETLEPPFTFHGFRYVEITGLDRRPTLGTVTGIVAHSAMERTGHIRTSSPLVNQLFRNIIWGQKGNYLEVPTDCPQRDERLGWTGDAQFFMDTAVHNFDIASFMSRWLRTLIVDAQFDDGTFAHVAPKVGERGGSTAWGDAAIVCTHALYREYGETRLIDQHLDALVRYMDWLNTRTDEDGLTRVGGYGDWLHLDDPTPSELIDTAYRAELARLMREMAEAVGRDDLAARFGRERQDSVDAFHKHFLLPNGALRDSGQTGYALAYTMDLIPETHRPATAKHFAAAIEAKNNHLATGFIGTPRLLPALRLADEEGGAAMLLLNETYPSWLYQVKLGATTMWERWNGWMPERGFADVGMNSFNHYAFGSVGAYLYRHVAGITPLAPGYTRIGLSPVITPGLDHAEATYHSLAGEIRSAWRRRGVQIEYDFTIPPNTIAELTFDLPNNVQIRPENITEGGKRLRDVRGVTVMERDEMRDEPNVLRLQLLPGTYRFRMGPAAGD